MLFYVSVADNHTGEFLGGAHIHAEKDSEASRAAAALLPGRCVETALVRLPQHLADQIPPSVIGKLLSEPELQKLAGEVTGNFRLLHYVSDGEQIRTLEES